MVLVSMLFLIFFILYFAQMRNNLVEIYEGNDDDITDSQQIFWLLKNSQLQPKYSIPVDWSSTMNFRKGSDRVVISVHGKNAERAHEIIINYRLEQRKMVRNIENERRKSESLFLG